MENTVVAFSNEGEGLYLYDNPSYPSTMDVICCDVFGNAGGNYGGTLEDQTGINGNFSEDPLFCDLEAGDLTLASLSPCLPDNHPYGYMCGLIGALDEGCVVISAGEDQPLSTGLPMLRASPTPFTGTVSLSYDAGETSVGTMSVFDVTGHPVWRYKLDAPSGVVAWDGTDTAGNRVASGLYFVHLDVNAKAEVKRLLLIR